MGIVSSQRFLAVYSGVLTFAFAATVLLGFSAPPRDATFDAITVRRLNIVEPDGTLRFVLSCKSDFPGTYVKGKEHPRPDRRTAGMLFLNDEGSEVGGLVFGGSRAGSRDGSGKIESHGHLSFDQYMATQVLALQAFEEGGERASRLVISDWRERDGETGQPRLVLGKDRDRSMGIALKDSQGRNRLVLRIGPDGNPIIQFLDADGKVTNQMSATPN
jgi:hypothetical protein